ncbi:MAG TPA: Asp-tRNA(Asn)/Glu-tRNA(Gln) amidotransferase subunit GatC [Dehalococcoidia bacterium]|nr:Asp-tRNA(Asn)/Glu-tRNA(Gln) amidotransferase subunit GatC [Dehalococcoidia bacterium]
MPLSREEVLHVARLARVGVEPADLDLLTDQLAKILDYFEILNEVNVSAVSPTAQVGGLGTVMREDEVRPSAPPEETLANAPRVEDGFFRIKAVLE